MPKYIAILATEQPFGPKAYPSLFKFFEACPHGVHFRPGVIAFDSADDTDTAYKALCKHLHDGDEISVFQLSEGCWRFDRLKNGNARDKQMRSFLGVGT